MPSGDQLIYLNDLLRKRDAYEIICRQKNVGLDVTELGQHRFCVLTLLCFAWWWFSRLLIGSGTMADRRWCVLWDTRAWNSSSTPVIVASGDNAICWTPAMIAWKELSYDDAELGGARLLWVELCIAESSSSVVAKSRAPAASASWAWACWTVCADRTSWSWRSHWTCSVWVCS